MACLLPLLESSMVNQPIMPLSASHLNNGKLCPRVMQEWPDARVAQPFLLVM